MTVGDSIKRAAEGTKNVTEKAVDAVETKVSDVTDTVQDALHDAGQKIQGAVGRDGSESFNPRRRRCRSGVRRAGQ